MDHLGFLWQELLRFTWGLACPNSSRLGGCLTPKPALGRTARPSSLAHLEGFWKALSCSLCAVRKLTSGAEL